MEDGGSRSSRLLPAAAKYKSMSPARLPISRSPCLTIPPGISPTTLLDSPVLLTNVKVEPSPTTGTFTIPSVVNQIGQELVASPPRSSDSSSCEEGCSEEFEFRPRSRLGSGVSQPLGVLSYTRTELEGCAPKNFGEYSSCIYANSVFKPEPETVMLKNLTSSQVATYHEGDIKSVSSSEMISSKMQHIDDFTNSSHALLMDHKGPDLLNSTDKNCDDGYNWRKYGQKHVKGSEFPRSYYKCTHPNCQVKKQLERSHDGQITDIIYKGKHDHPKPQPSRKLAIGAVLAGQEEERNNGTSSSTGGDDKNSKVDDRKCHLNDTNRTPELSPIPEVSNYAGPAELSNNKYDDIADDDDDDPEAKRRRKENSSMDIAGMNKITREPRVVIQTLSEVDILDDGYRWRKYGQKVVKGNPNPRSYYKCTNLGCPVRKHVERASHDPKAVITTYEGKHNHDVPAARTTSHDTAAASMAMNSSASIYDCVPAPVGYDGVRTAPQNFNQCDDSDSISLDLGVGLSPRQRDGNNHLPQNIALERARSMEIDSSSSGSSKLVVPSAPSAFYYGMPKNGTNYFGSTESPGEGFNLMVASASHPSDAYNVNIGNLLMRP